MALPPGLAAARRLIAIVGAVLALVAVGGALAYASQDTGKDCGSGWKAYGTRAPSPLFSPAELQALKESKRNRYEAAAERSAPYNACREAGSRRLIRAGEGAALILIPVGGVLAFLFWPRREELVDDDDEVDDDHAGGPQPVAANRANGWLGR